MGRWLSQKRGAQGNAQGDGTSKTLKNVDRHLKRVRCNPAITPLSSRTVSIPEVEEKVLVTCPGRAELSYYGVFLLPAKLETM